MRDRDFSPSSFFSCWKNSSEAASRNRSKTPLSAAGEIVVSADTASQLTFVVCVGKTSRPIYENITDRGRFVQWYFTLPHYTTGGRIICSERDPSARKSAPYRKTCGIRMRPCPTIHQTCQATTSGCAGVL